ncbi:hypothetical protein I6A60_03740 [Frankia sp. AgB1.9]|uniref:hypothetical protein n=1 Tax=unclassified Frankia TaxID=2632575 RepID=UPI001932A680|nr:MULTISPECIES: hypothetical protein [unclassified Frankia]MBL7492350.1 hypothetical protein [Frankia sp. AgW1.1]MBL7546995.1 hypothetical protein [Frankia sp. AgB1.9]MBL7625110.1 hypothetical protein [Frankia sp. AgB1.8]
MTGLDDPGYGPPDPGYGQTSSGYDVPTDGGRPGRDSSRGTGAHPSYTAGLRDPNRNAPSSFAASGPPVKISYRTPSGGRETLSARVERAVPASAGAADVARVLAPLDPLDRFDPNHDRLIQKMVPAPAATLDACAPLFNELQIGLHLARVLRGAYPPQLSELVGYDVESEAPFLLVRQLRGSNVVKPASQQLLEEIRPFQQNLLRCLSVLEAADVVHRAIAPRRVLWNGSTVQLVNFRFGRLTGEPALAAPDSEWAAPEARAPRYIADPAEDLWSAGRVLVHVFDPQRLAGRPGAPDPRLLRAGLADTLDGVFRDRPKDRPEIRRIMQDLTIDYDFFDRRDLPRPSLADDRLDEGAVRFRAIRAAKRRPTSTGGLP